jgi:hypothetical protein
LAVLLALLIVQVAGGVMLVRCLHSGRVHIASLTELATSSHHTLHIDEDCASMDMGQMDMQHCMEYDLEQLSASIQPPVQQLDFTAIQPVLFTIESLWLEIAEADVKSRDFFCPDKVPIPPRAYFAKIRILII